MTEADDWPLTTTVMETWGPSHSGVVKLKSESDASVIWVMVTVPKSTEISDAFRPKLSPLTNTFVAVFKKEDVKRQM